MRTSSMKIDGMMCSGCADRIRAVLETEAGVRRAEISFEDASASVSFNEHTTSEERIREVIERAGFSIVEK